MGRPYHEAETLQNLYHDKNLSGVEIAEKFDVASQTIYDWMDKHGIERDVPNADNIKDEKLLKELYCQKQHSISEIANQFRLSYTTVWRALDKFDIERRSFGEHQIADELKDKGWLIHQNHDLNKPIEQISEEVGVSASSVHNAFERHGIENARSNRISESAKEVLQDPGEMERLYIDEGLSTIKIGNRLGVHSGTVSNWLNRHDIETRSQSDITKELHPRYNPEAKAHVYDKKWATVRETVIERDGEECQECGISRQEHQEERGMDLDVHHIVPQREIDDKYNTENLITMCRSCHITKEQEGE